jgi:hypothetical protein
MQTRQARETAAAAPPPAAAAAAARRRLLRRRRHQEALLAAEARRRLLRRESPLPFLFKKHLRDSGLPADVLLGKLKKDISFALRRGTIAQGTTAHADKLFFLDLQRSFVALLFLLLLPALRAAAEAPGAGGVCGVV